MKHSVYGKKLGRNKNQRTALFRSLVQSLINHETIQTTEAKAKAIKGLVDKIIHKAQMNSNSSTAIVNSFLLKKELIEKLNRELIPRFASRTSGFTTTARLGSRIGDGAMMVRMSLVGSSGSDASRKSARIIK